MVTRRKKSKICPIAPVWQGREKGSRIDDKWWGNASRLRLVLLSKLALRSDHWLPIPSCVTWWIWAKNKNWDCEWVFGETTVSWNTSLSTWFISPGAINIVYLIQRSLSYLPDLINSSPTLAGRINWHSCCCCCLAMGSPSIPLW